MTPHGKRPAVITFIALPAAQGCAKPVIIRVERNASHGYRPTDRLIEEVADPWAFAARQLGMAVPK